MNWLAKLFQPRPSADYVRLLEEERARLLAEQERFRETITRLNRENRSLTNLLLGAAGHAPIEERDKGPLPHVARRSLHQLQLRTEMQSLNKALERERRENGKDAQATAGITGPKDAA